jgi:hypothetical protein
VAPHRHRSPRGPAWALGVSFALAGCSDVATRPDPEGEALRLGRVHIVLEPTEDRDAAEDFVEANEAQLDVTARFAFVRGLDEDFVRARVGMPVLAHEQVPVSECVPSDQLAIDPGEPAALDGEMRELVLVDAGDLTVRIGDTDVDVPLALVPDLLPYMSGVEYLYYGDGLPEAMDSVLAVEAEGSSTEELPAFTVEGQVPAGLGLTFTEEDLAELGDDALVFRWSSTGDGLVTVRLLPLIAGEPAGEEITCVLADAGQARLDLPELRTLGLPPAADTVRVVASRATTTTFDAGEFQTSELIVERRAAIQVPLR